MNSRTETTADINQIADLYLTMPAATILPRLRKNPKFDPGLSFVMELDGTIIAHVLYFPVSITYNRCRVWSLLLTFAVVRPEMKRKGYLTALIGESLRIVKAKGYKSVLVHGLPFFYNRFGFKPAENWQIVLPDNKKEHDVILLGLELEPNGLAGMNGEMQYSYEFS